MLVAHGRRAGMRRWHTTIPCVDGARHGGGGLPEAWHNTVVDVPACVKRGAGQARGHPHPCLALIWCEAQCGGS
jgi:hypothetical protein